MGMSAGTAAVVAGGIAATGAVGGSLISANASKSAASQQAAADQQAAAIQTQEFNQNQANLAPYNAAGQANLGLYSNFYQTSADQLGQTYNNANSHIPQAMTEANLIQTPGYQFNLSQGLRAMQNSSAARGLGVSGAALQGAGTYATGLADSTYQNQFNNQNTIYNDYLQQANLKQNQLNTIYNQIGAPVTLGENAAAMAGNSGTTGAANIGNALTNAGIAQSAGTTGSANALSSGLSSAGNSTANGLQYLGLMNALQGNNNGTPSTSAILNAPSVTGSGTNWTTSTSS
jgi:hypothetical protein